MNEQMDGRAMQPIDDGMLRAYLDGDPVLDDGARGRIAAALVEQPALAERLAALRADATVVEAAFIPFAMPEPDAAHRERAYRRIQTRLTTEHRTGFVTSIKERFADMTSLNRTTRVRRFAFASSLGALALVLLLVFAPVTDAFNAVLDTFRYQPTQFAVITINTSQFPQFAGGGADGKPAAPQINGSLLGPAPTPAAKGQDQQQLMQELAKYVSVTSSFTQAQGQLPGRQVKSAADAKAAVGRDVTAPTHLPSGVANTPQYYVSDHQTADATLHLNEIRPALTSAGMGSLIPATGDSATIHVDAPAASIVSYGFTPTALNPTAQGAAATNQQGVAVIAMGSPTIDVNGLDVPGIVNTISVLPNMPPELIAQLKSADLQHTLIIPVTDQQTVKNSTINGAPSTTISQKDGSMSVVLWITKDTVLHVAVGTYGASEMEQVAASVK